MPFQHDQHQKDVCEFRYIVRGETPEEIAAAPEVEASESTIRRWARAEGWKEAQTMRNTSARTIAARLRATIEATLDECDDEGRLPDASERDGMYKTWKMVDKMDREAERASNGLEILDELSAFIDEEAPELREAVQPILAEFGQALVESATA